MARDCYGLSRDSPRLRPRLVCARAVDRGHLPAGHAVVDGHLPAVVDHYDALFGLNLTAAQKADLVEYLESL